MALPSSGQLRLYADIGVELGVGQSNVSLGSMSDSAGFSEPDTMSDFYGYVDAIAPSVTTNSATGVSYNYMTARGNVTSDGGGAITQRGFYFGTSSNYSSNAKYSVSGTTGSFSRQFTSLSANTTYYMTAYAINSVGESVGSTVSRATGTQPINAAMTISAGTGMGSTFSSTSNTNSQSVDAYYSSINNTTGGNVTLHQQAGGSMYNGYDQNVIYYMGWPSPFSGNESRITKGDCNPCTSPLVLVKNNIQNGFNFSNKRCVPRIGWWTPYVPGATGNAYHNHIWSKSGLASYTRRLITVNITIPG